ncbi:PaaI family thioesterase [Actinorugispora endophytica]|uniref:Acyl-coenzyme A thioesterase THEM4 n=1 Tax=Actinorugispora endophytica TaxID=1605990 RepID=A0A4V3D7M4_9ACTN|nr:PaaI family thioesterase [Actinorugispora endophytica]TDQ48487.1 thioesterase superfamily protein [Actinorugispora endophytica]
MTVDVQPVSELPDPADFGFTVVERDALPTELLALVDQVRTLADTVAHTGADAAELAAASRVVADLSERLDVRRRPLGTMFSQVAPDGRIDYGTVANVVNGPLNPIAPPLELRPDGEGLSGEVTLVGLYEGPPGLVHGGWIAAMLDQALGEVAATAGGASLTANLDVNYRKPTPLNAPLTVTSRVTGVERRKVLVSGEIRHNGEITAEGTAVMVKIALPGS